MTTELIPHEPPQPNLSMLPAYQKIADPLAFCTEVGKALHVTFGLNSPHHGTIMALAMLCKNRDPLEHAQRYHGDGSMRASAIQAEFQSRGGRIEWVDLGEDNGAAKAKFTHPVFQPTPLEIKYTLEDAKRQVGEKFSKDGSNWKTNPGAMLRAALIRKAIKIIDPGIIGGYDSFVDTDYGPTGQTQPPVAITSTKTKEQDIAARRAELLAGSTDQTAVDAEYTKPVAETVSAATAKAEPVETSSQGNADSPSQPDDTPPFAGDPEKTPCTNEQLQQLVALAVKFPSPDDPSRKMNMQEISSNVCKACKVSAPNEATMGQIERLVTRFREMLSAMPPE